MPTPPSPWASSVPPPSPSSTRAPRSLAWPARSTARAPPCPTSSAARGWPCGSTPTRGGATYLSAGAIPPLLVTAAGASRYLEAASGGPIGVREPRSEAPIELGPGDTLVLCSDGLVEERRASIDLGLERLSGTAARRRTDAAQDLADALLADRTGSSDPGDDIAVLTCRIA
ncbi:serine/threonine-protein phosphatase [Aquihabitans sp. G128]|uniref:PP2C family protein-serine/threonine phosphatase n=1 Tax=Aquihabitans sp. G128 TaxID=2849779 RepID=UPI001C23E444|nr:PP2C family protein-serine/threonine phosphatase [Aquihabitans sp. G128]QXC59286.1 serine/threonine-protein phosphatase [Aquihabitans sp. G128]